MATQLQTDNQSPLFGLLPTPILERLGKTIIRMCVSEEQKNDCPEMEASTCLFISFQEQACADQP